MNQLDGFVPIFLLFNGYNHPSCIILLEYLAGPHVLSIEPFAPSGLPLNFELNLGGHFRVDVSHEGVSLACCERGLEINGLILLFKNSG